MRTDDDPLSTGLWNIHSSDMGESDYSFNDNTDVTRKGLTIADIDVAKDSLVFLLQVRLGPRACHVGIHPGCDIRATRACR